MNESYQAVMSALGDHLSAHVTEMMKEDFDIDVSLIKDPETEEVVMQNLDGTNLTEGQVFAITYYERGWYNALEAVGTLAQHFDKTGEVRYTGRNDTPPDKEDHD